MVIDLHEMNRNEAIRFFIDKYNEAFRGGYREEITVIHGYGSSGRGGVIKKELREFLDSHRGYLTYTVATNPGSTLVTPLKAINEMQDMISMEVLEFCRISPKTMDKIKGNFFKKYKNNEINACVKRLVKQGYLTVNLKKNGEVYQTKK
ncbi:hypothetical protein PM10SUCC1_29500 [Propionigenium maris DSM 9537]|uniref:Smr domain-containing protein n=1 Tax=Propionigenium maris DSM 9537 TaxID=1123000 RepID=A0A9W6LNJ8_9FUSO|nr:Smr/MutS family protein [Propionigenium maris]GLI57436.1 hypothetical protein PM10SUCC1_29500 [Propionigenium maris DSM 9537]